MRRALLFLLAVVAGCATVRPDTSDMRLVPGGAYVAGSTQAERETAYEDSRRTSGSDGARRGRWFEREPERQQATLPAFWLDRTHVTNRAYARFVRGTGRQGPTIDEAGWKRQGYRQDYATQVVRSLWQGTSPPAGRDDHPVVLVTYAEAKAFCAWRHKRLPSAAELEKAMRGGIYPWGDAWDERKLNGATVNDTEPVGRYPPGPHGHLDLAGQAFHWTATPWSDEEQTVKGSGWDDFAGVARAAAAHGRPRGVRHVLVGFRCAATRE